MTARTLQVLLSFAAVVLCGASAAPHASARQIDDAYMDEASRELVRLARVRRSVVDRRIAAYETTAQERFSARLRAGVADRLAYRRETAARIDWRREGPVRFDVLGMREVAPLFTTDQDVPEDMSAELLRLAFNPSDPDILFSVDSAEVRHPLREGSEEHYRFASGDTSVIRLPDGRAVRMRELRVLPRRRDPTLVNGSFWLEAETHAIVQAYFRMARGIDADTDVTQDGGIASRLALGLLKPIRMEIEFIAVEYGLWEMQWWLPRLVAAQGTVQLNRFRIPLTYERTYSGYVVQSDPAGVADAEPLPRVACRAQVRFATSPDATSPDAAARDSARQAITDSERARREGLESRQRAARGDTTALVPCTREFIIAAGSDSALLASPALPPTVWGRDLELLSDDERRGIMQRVRSTPGAPLSVGRPRLLLGLQSPGLVRYNRVEGLSLGARTVLDAGSTRFDMEARLGLAEQEPRGEAGAAFQGDRLHARFAGYRRLQPAGPWAAPPGTPSTAMPGTLASLGALLFGRDDLDYFDAVGADLVLRPGDTRRQWFDLRLYGERQRSVETHTDWSAARMFDSDRRFAPVTPADPADQLGGQLRLRAAAGLNPSAPRVGTELSLQAETGDFTFLRPELQLRVSTGLPLGLSLAVEGAAGTAAGDTLPLQALYRLGGAATLRGYPGNLLLGERYWRSRTELGVGVPGARLSGFYDVGWTGPRHRFDSAGALTSAGVGASLLDGVLRLDLARRLQGDRGWRVHLHFGSGM